MKHLRYFGMICLVGQIILSGCKQKDIIPTIDNLVGIYDCKLEWYGAWNLSVEPNVKRFQVFKSSKADNLLEIQMEIDNSWSETWQVQYRKYPEYALIFMDKQAVREEKSVQGYSIYQLQVGSGKAFGDSLTFEGERFEDPRLGFGRTFCRYRAKKKS